MKKLLLAFSAALLVAPALMAETASYEAKEATDIQGTLVEETTSDKGQTTAKHYEDVTALKLGDFSFTFDNAGASTATAFYYSTVASGSDECTIRLYNGGKMSLSAPDGATMTSVTFKGSNGKNVDKLTVSEGTLTAADGNALATGTSNVLWTGEAQSLNFTFAGTYRIKSVEIEYTTTSSVTPASEMPAFNPGSCSFTGSLSVEMTAAQGAKIYYTLDGTAPTEASTLYEAPLLLTATTTVKAVALEEGKRLSGVVTETYTLEVAYDTLAALMEAGLADTKNAVKYSGKATVVYQNGNYLYLTDGQTPLLAYGKLDTAYEPGDVITGFAGKMTVYNNLNELNVDAATFAAPVEKVAAPQAKVMDIENIEAADQNTYVVLENVKVVATEADGKTSYKLVDSKDADIVAYPRFSDVTFPTTDTAYDVYCFVSVFKEDLQVFPVDFVEHGSAATIEAAMGEAIYFDMQGRRLSAPAPGQPVIRLQQGHAAKVIF